MAILVTILFFAVLLGLYDLLRGINKNIKEQTEEIKKLREDLTQGKD